MRQCCRLDQSRPAQPNPGAGSMLTALQEPDSRSERHGRGTEKPRLHLWRALGLPDEPRWRGLLRMRSAADPRTAGTPHQCWLSPRPCTWTGQSSCLLLNHGGQLQGMGEALLHVGQKGEGNGWGVARYCSLLPLRGCCEGPAPPLKPQGCCSMLAASEARCRWQIWQWILRSPSMNLARHVQGRTS